MWTLNLAIINMIRVFFFYRYNGQLFYWRLKIKFDYVRLESPEKSCQPKGAAPTPTTLPHLGSVEGHTGEDGLRDAGALELITHPLVDLGRDLCVGRHLRLQRLAVRAAVDGRVVEVLLGERLLRQQPVDGVLLVEDLRHHQLLVDQLRADGRGHKAWVVQASQLRLAASSLAGVRRRRMRERRHWRGWRLLGRAARDRLLLLGETQVVVVVVGAGRGEVR